MNKALALLRMLPATQSLAPSLSSNPRPLLQLLPTISSSNPLTSFSRRRFAESKTDEEVNRERTLGVPKETLEDTQDCFQLWKAWGEHCNSTTAAQIGSIVQMPNSKLQHWLTLFILEVRRQDISVFPPASLHHITAGLMRHLRWNGRSQVNLFRDCVFFCDFRASLNAETSRSAHRSQRGAVVEQRSPRRCHSTELARHTCILQRTVFFCIEWEGAPTAEKLTLSNTGECQGERPYLCYTEDISKNHPEGLKGKA